MLVYRYDPETKIFLHTEPAMLDPLETEKAGENIYLLPANCTFTEPPEPREGYNIVYDTQGEKWNYEEQPPAEEDKQPEPAPEPTPEEKKAAEIAAADARYQADKTTLLNYYVEALATGNTELAAEISTEIKELNATYDTEMGALGNE